MATKKSNKKPQHDSCQGQYLLIESIYQSSFFFIVFRKSIKDTAAPKAARKTTMFTNKSTPSVTAGFSIAFLILKIYCEDNQENYNLKCSTPKVRYIESNQPYDH